MGTQIQIHTYTYFLFHFYGFSFVFGNFLGNCNNYSFKYTTLQQQRDGERESKKDKYVQSKNYDEQRINRNYRHSSSSTYNIHTFSYYNKTKIMHLYKYTIILCTCRCKYIRVSPEIGEIYFERKVLKHNNTT